MLNNIILSTRYFTRERKEVAGRTMIEDKKIKFDDYVKLLSINISLLKEKEKESIFLKWKWGMENADTNWDMESANRDSFGSRITREFIASCDEYGKYYWNSQLNFERRCNEIRRYLGLNQVRLIHDVADIEEMPSMFEKAKAEWEAKQGEKKELYA